MRSETIAVGCHRLRNGLSERFMAYRICHRLRPLSLLCGKGVTGAAAYGGFGWPSSSIAADSSG
jgi:hypothetical protein